MGYGSLFGNSNEEPPSPFCEWPSPPFRGRAICSLRGFTLGFGGVRYVHYGASLGDSGGVRLGYRSLFRDLKEEPPSPFCEWPSPPRGRAMGYRSLFKDSKEEPPSPFCEWPSPPRGRAMPFSKFIEKVNFVNISYLLFSISFSTPSPPQSLAALSPFQGACGGLREFIRGFERRTPLAILRMALSPKGACDSPLRQFIKGACDGLRDFVRGFRGRAMRWGTSLGNSMGVR